MLASIALAPGVLRGAAESQKHLEPLRNLFLAVSQNAIIVASDRSTLAADIVRTAASARGAGSQQLQVLSAELAKDINKYTAQPPPGWLPKDASVLGAFLEAANWGRVDAIIVADDNERRACIDRGSSNDSLVTIAEYSESNIESRRRIWLETQRLDTMSSGVAASLVGRTIKYSTRVVIADKMIGLSSTRQGRSLEGHLLGVAYVVRAWIDNSPYSNTMKLDLEIVTVAGIGGSRGVVDPGSARAQIGRVASSIADLGAVERIRISLKQDGDPQIFNDRLLACGGRVWGVHHGFDDLGKLIRKGKKRPTMFDPDSRARGTVLRDIQALRDA